MAVVVIARGPWSIDTATITTVTRQTNGRVLVVCTVNGNFLTFDLTLAEAITLNVANAVGFIPEIPPTLPSQPFLGSFFPNTRIAVMGAQSIDGRAIVMAYGQATTDAGIVADIGADSLYSDGSIYFSTVATGGILFQKVNDVWVVQGAGGGGASGIYSALLTQTAGNAPVATVLANNTGTTITPARTSAGLYTLTSSGTPFTAAKTQIILGGEVQNQPATTFDCIGAKLTSTSVITIQTSLVTLNAGPPPTGIATDGLLTGKSIQVLIYP
jgi:hypothetical protein